MSEDLRHECAVVALYWLADGASRGGPASRSVHRGDVAPLVPPMLLDLQNRGQLAAGLASYDPDRVQLLDTFRALGTVSEAFVTSQPEHYRKIMEEYRGRAAIGHTRYATCGLDDARYAQPFERHHGRVFKWFSFAFNGQLANYASLRDRLLGKKHYHFSLNTDTEILMHSLAWQLRGEKPPPLRSVMTSLARNFDGAYNIVYLDAMGRMFVARDPLGFRPLSWAVQGRLFAAASESVALSNLGFSSIHALAPGEMAVIEDGGLRIDRFAPERTPSHCFFEWVYFSNVASTLDGVGVYTARSRLGQRLADLEDQVLDGSCIVVPVPDTAKAAADAFAFRLGMPSVEGLIRNRYVGRTFIQPGTVRRRSAKGKYTPLAEVLSGRRVFLVEDSIVRSTTLRALVQQIRERGGAREVHVRVACPPIVAPCFYGIDMSTLEELFAPRFAPRGYAGEPAEPMLRDMARELGVDSLRYLGVNDLNPCLGFARQSLCTGCVTGLYPTRWGNLLFDRARKSAAKPGGARRTYEQPS